MNRIHLLPDEIVAHIAAGEVIERPAYIVKELIDNAIDAGASRVSIELMDSGCESIIVQDDGYGMSRSDLEQSIQIHTTSKIRHLDDLSRISSLGFRGEALASIAAIATLTIQSKTPRSAFGSQLRVIAQQPGRVETIGIPIGTRVIVEDIFASTPVRKKFQKSTRSELLLIMQILRGFTLTHPSVHFVLRNNKKTILDIPLMSLAERIQDSVGEDAFAQYIPLKFQESYITLNGWIGHPALASAHPTQWICLNSRIIIDPLIKEAVRDATREYMEKDKHVPFFLFLQIPTELVDINVHPRKETVRFASAETIFTAVREVIQDTFSKKELTYESSLLSPIAHGPITQTVAGITLRNHVLEKEKSIRFTRFSQFHNTYIIAESSSGIVILDQHAAQERILYEQFRSALKAEQRKGEKTIGSWKLKLTKEEIGELFEYEDHLKQLGFDIRPDGSLGAIPSLFVDRDLTAILKDVLADLTTSTSIQKEDSLTHRLLTTLACRSAVKAGDPLTVPAMREIVMQLQKTPHKYTCPHGRPTTVAVSLVDLEKLFHRR